MIETDQKETTCKPQTRHVLSEVFDRYIEDTITEEQLRRVLDPVIKMIMEGKFDRPYRKALKRVARAISSVFSNKKSSSERKYYS